MSDDDQNTIEVQAAAQVQFDNYVLAVARMQLGIISKQLREDNTDGAKLLKLAAALEKVQRVGNVAFGK